MIAFETSWYLPAVLFPTTYCGLCQQAESASKEQHVIITTNILVREWLGGWREAYRLDEGVDGNDLWDVIL